VPVDPALIDEVKISLVDEGRGLKSVVRTLTTEVVSGKAVKLGVDYRYQAVERRPIAAAPV
jgi:hypothetical protein